MHIFFLNCFTSFSFLVLLHHLSRLHSSIFFNISFFTVNIFWLIGGRGPEQRRATDYATAGSGPTRQSWSTGLGEQCKSSRRGMRWVFIILTSRSFFLCWRAQPCIGLGTIWFESAGVFFVVTILLWRSLWIQVWIRVIKGPRATLVSPTFTHNRVTCIEL